MTDLPEMFRCDRLNMTLSKPGCARLWLSANSGSAPAAWEGRLGCRNCPLGALHAGKTVEAATALTDALRNICPRCERVASRMIGGELCVSCYNRAREVRIGRNAKGGRPLLTDRLHTRRLVVIEGSSDRLIDRQYATGLPEVMIAVARRATKPVAFCRPQAAFDE